MERQIIEQGVAASDLLRAVAGPQQPKIEAAARNLYRHLRGRPGWVPLTSDMFPFFMPAGWSNPMVRLIANSIDVAMKRPMCHLSSDVTKSRVVAVCTDILPETLAVGGKPATVIYGEHAPFNLADWTIESVLVSGMRTKVFIQAPTLWASIADEDRR